MSLPFYSITCSGCSYEDGYSFGINFEYEGPPEREPMVGVAWCKACDSIVETCTPFNEEHARAEIADLEAWINTNKAGWFARFSITKKLETQKTHKRIQDVNARLAYFQSTPYKDRCMSCGSHDVFPFSLPDGEGEVENLNIRHSCGGQLRIRMDGRLAFGRRPKVIFNDLGVIVRDERKQNA